MLNILSCFLSSADFFSKNYFTNAIRVPNRLDPDQAGHAVSADDTSGQSSDVRVLNARWSRRLWVYANVGMKLVFQLQRLARVLIVNM